MHWIRVLIICCFSISIFNACDDEPDPEVPEEETVDPAYDPTFTNIYTMTFTNLCASCHAPGGNGYEITTPDNLDLSDQATAYSELVSQTSTQNGCGDTGTENCGLLVDPGNPDGSYLLNKLTGQNVSFATDRMPNDNQGLSDGEIEAVRQWIANGAADN